MALTTNEKEIIEKFKQAAMEHPQVKWFDVGYQDFLFDSQRDLEFPCVFLQSNGVTNGDLRLTNNFTIYCLDLPLMESEADNTEFEYQEQYVDSRNTCLAIINYILGQVRGENRQLFSLRRIGPAIPDQGQLDGATGYRITVEVEYDSLLNTGFEFLPEASIEITSHAGSAEENSGDIQLGYTTEGFTGTPTIVWSSPDGGTISNDGLVDDGTVGEFTYQVTGTYLSQVASDTTTIAWTMATAPSVTIGNHAASQQEDSGDITLTATTANFSTTPTIVWSSTDGGVIDANTGVVSDDTVGTFTYVATATAGSEVARDTTTIQWTAAPFVSAFTSLALDTFTFTGTGGMADITLTGTAGTNVSLSLVDVTPVGWITDSNIVTATGSIPSDGTFESTMSIPSTLDTETRTFRVRATNTDMTTDIISSALVTQTHTQTDAQGDLIADFTVVEANDMATFSSNVTGGDPNFTLELFDTDPGVGSPTALETLVATTLGTQTFTAIDTSGLTEDTTYYLRVTDVDSDTLTETIVITVTTAQTVFAYSNSYHSGSGTGVMALNALDLDSSGNFHWTMENSSGTSLDVGNLNTTHSIPPMALSAASVSGHSSSSLNGQTITVTFYDDLAGTDEIGSFDTTYHNTTPTFANLEFGFTGLSTSSSNYDFTIASNYVGDLDGLFDSVGLDYVSGHVNDVPNGSNRISVTNYTVQAFPGSFQGSFSQSTLSSGNYSIVGWATSGSDTTYGLVTHITIP